MNLFVRSVLFLLFGTVSLAHGQLLKLEHVTGTKTYGKIEVNVKGTGQVETLTYCNEDTGPYYLGYNYANPTCNDGTYTFTFSKTIKKIVINLSALSHSSSYDEEARFYINGEHVKVTRLGKNNSCGEGLCILTPEGNILPCRDCGGSGVNGLVFEGNITSFTIECKIISGVPMGFVAGVWIDPTPAQEEKTLVNYSLKLEESSAGTSKLAVIEGDLENAELSIKDKNGMVYPLFYRSIEKTRIVLDLCDLRRGEFVLEIKNGNKIENQKLLIL